MSTTTRGGSPVQDQKQESTTSQPTDAADVSEQERKNLEALEQVDPEGPCNLIVKGLPKKMREEGLYELFRDFGSIHSTKVMVDLRRHGPPQSKEYGFVLFNKGKEALKALEAMNGAKIPVPPIQLPKEPKKKMKQTFGGQKGEGEEESAGTKQQLWREAELMVAVAALQEEAGGARKKKEPEPGTETSPSETAEATTASKGKKGKKIKQPVEPAEAKKGTPSERLYITNIPHYAGKEQLVQHFKRYGRLKEMTLLPVDPKNKNCRNHRGVAFARFATVAEATAAINGLDNETMVCGYKTELDYTGEVYRVTVVPRAIRVRYLEDQHARDLRVAKRDAKIYERRMSPSSIAKRTLTVTAGGADGETQRSSTAGSPSSTPASSKKTSPTTKDAGVVGSAELGAEPATAASGETQQETPTKSKTAPRRFNFNNKMPMAMMPPGTSPPMMPTPAPNPRKQQQQPGGVQNQMLPQSEQAPHEQQQGKKQRRRRNQQPQHADPTSQGHTQYSQQSMQSFYDQPPNYNAVLPPPPYHHSKRNIPAQQ